jgi:hypothetical protein
MSPRGYNKTLEMRRRIQAIEDEFQEPLDQIIIVMRQQGCNWRTIAGVLEVSYTNLLKWRKKFDFAQPQRSYKRYEEPRGAKSPIEDIAKKHGYRSFVALYRDMRLSKKMTVEQVARTIGVSEATIRKWTPKELKDIRYNTEKNAISARKNLEKARISVNREYHPWNAPEEKWHDLSRDNLT